MMKKLVCYIMIFTILMGAMPLEVYGEDYIDFINIKVDQNKKLNEEVVLTSQYGFYFYHKNNKNESILEIADKEIRILANELGIIEIYDIDGLLITTIPGDGSIIIGSQDLNNSIIKVDENKYRDYITFLINNDSLLKINHIHIENYLLGVLPKEIPAFSPVDSLRAQAVVARSFTYTNLGKHNKEGYDLCVSTDCQVYGGYDGEHPNTSQAIIDTYGEYIAYDGVIISAFYHSSSGGYTESSEKVWGGNLPYLVAVEDVYSVNAPNSSWSVKLTPRELESKLGANGINLGQVRDIQIIETTDSDRVEKIKIVGSLGEKIITGANFRTMIGVTSLKSTLFNVNKEGSSDTRKIYVMNGSGQGPKEVNLSGVYIVDGNNRKTVSRSTSNRIRGNNSSTNIEGTINVKPSTFTFEGKGSGHGVGMSQYGAIEMAKQGYNYNDIIKHYYSGVEIINLGK